MEKSFFHTFHMLSGIWLLVLSITIVFPNNLFADELEEELALSLPKVIEITLQNNLDIAVEKIKPEIKKESITNENAAFDPTLFSDISVEKDVTPSASSFASDVTSTDKRSYSIGLKQTFKTNTSYELKFSSERRETDSEFTGLDPQFDSFVDLELKQPLLKNFGIDLTTRKITVAINNRDISQSDFKSLVIQTISDVQDNYWDLVFKIDDLKVKKQSLDLAKDLENRIKIQVEVGVLAPIEILQAQSEVAAREEAVIITENEIKDLEDELKTKLNFPSDAKEWNLRLLPTDPPSFKAEKFHLEESIKIALENRPDMEKLKLDLANKNIDVAFNKNQLYPTVNLEASFGLNGLSGDTSAINKFKGDYGKSVSRAFSGDYYSYDIGLKFEYPIGNRSAKSNLTASKLEVEKALIEIKNLEHKVTLDIKEAVREIETNAKRVKVTGISKKLAEEKLKAEEKKFEVGLSTSFKVLEFQEDLAEELSKEIKAIIDYKKSIVNLYKVVGITLEKNNVKIN